jgi:hypothetical protein
LAPDKLPDNSPDRFLIANVEALIRKKNMKYSRRFAADDGIKRVRIMDDEQVGFKYETT